MGLSGSQQAYRLAVVGVARVGTTRVGYYSRQSVPVAIDGTVRSGVILDAISIDLNTGNEPHRASLALKGGGGFVPQAGMPVVIGAGTTANPLFSGRLTTVTRTGARADERRSRYDCEAAGHLFELDVARVTHGVDTRSLTPRSVVMAVFAAMSPSGTDLGFSATWVDPTLPAVERFVLGPSERVSDGLARLFRAADALWFVDHDRTLHAFGVVDAAPGPDPSTLTSAASHVWDLSYTPTDLARVFTKVQVLGASQPTLADVDFGTQALVPIASASLLSNLQSVDSDVLAGTTEQWLLDGHLVVGSLVYRPEQAFEPTMITGTFLDTTVGANTLVVVSRNLSSLRPIESPRWYGIGGQYVYVASQSGVFSATASSIAYGYIVPTTGPGALTSDIPSGTPLTGVFNLIATSVPSARFIPAGATLQNIATRVNSAAVAEVSSLFRSAPLGVITHTFEDGRLSPDGAAAVASAALDRGAPGQWRALTFASRNAGFGVGRPVYASVSSFAESGALSISGVFAAQDVRIGEFGRLADRHGPVRVITAGAVRKPTPWQVLQGVR